MASPRKPERCPPRKVPWAALLLAGVLLAAYSPVVFRSFIFNDDLLMWIGPPDRPGTAHPQFGYFFVIGRPLFSLLAWPVWAWVDSPASLSAVRFAMIILLIGCGWRLQGWFRQVAAPPVVAALLPPILLLLPAVQTQMILANSFPHPIALWLAIEAARAAHRWIHARSARHLAAALALLFASMCIYPPTTFAYAALVFIHLVFRGEVRRSIRLLAPLVLTAGIYYVFARLSFLGFGAILAVPDDIMGSHHVVLADEGGLKVGLFWRVILQAANLWGISFQWAAVWVVLLVLLGGYAAVWAARRPPPETVGLYAGVCGLLIFVSLLPQLAARLNYYSMRSLTGISWILMTAVAWALFQGSGWLGRRHGPPALGCVLAAVLLACGVQGFRNMDRHIVGPARAEAGLIARRLAEDRQASHRILRVIPPWEPNYLWFREQPFNLLKAGDEYGYLSSGGGPNTVGLINFVLREKRMADLFAGIEVRPWAADEARPPPDEAVLVVDMNEVLVEMLAREAGHR